MTDDQASYSDQASYGDQASYSAQASFRDKRTFSLLSIDVWLMFMLISTFFCYFLLKRGGGHVGALDTFEIQSDLNR